MRKRGNLVLLAVSLILALGTTLVIVRELKAQSTTVATVAHVATETVVVAATDVPGHTQIVAKDVQLKQIPASAVTPGAATKVSQVIGQYTATKWLSGQQVIAGMYESAKSAAFSASIPSGDVAFTIPDSSVTGVDHLILPGDHIDILNYSSGSSVTMSNLLVLFVDKVQAAANPNTKPPAGSGADTLTVAVTPKQAQALAKLVSSGQLHFLLRKSTST